MSKRNDDPKELVHVGGAPNWLAEYQTEDTSVEDLAEYRILSRLKIVQSMSAEELKESFGEGSIIIAPGNVMVAKKKEPVLFVPVFFFTEFCLWGDRKDKVGPTIRDRSFDKAGDLARRARDPERREEEYEGGFVGRYVEHLNFAGFIYGDHEQKGTPCVLSFSRGEFGTGRNFINSITLRKVAGQTAPLWSQVWEMKTAFRDQGDKKWYGIEMSNPPEGTEPFIKQEEVEFFLGEHKSCKEDFEKSKLLVDHGGEDDAPVDPEEEFEG